MKKQERQETPFEKYKADREKRLAKHEAHLKEYRKITRREVWKEFAKILLVWFPIFAGCALIGVRLPMHYSLLRGILGIVGLIAFYQLCVSLIEWFAVNVNIK